MNFILRIEGISTPAQRRERSNDETNKAPMTATCIKKPLRMHDTERLTVVDMSGNAVACFDTKRPDSENLANAKLLIESQNIADALGYLLNAAKHAYHDAKPPFYGVSEESQSMLNHAIINAEYLVRELKKQD